MMPPQRMISAGNALQARTIDLSRAPYPVLMTLQARARCPIPTLRLEITRDMDSGVTDLPELSFPRPPDTLMLPPFDGLGC